MSSIRLPTLFKSAGFGKSASTWALSIELLKVSKFLLISFNALISLLIDATFFSKINLFNGCCSLPRSTKKPWQSSCWIFITSSRSLSSLFKLINGVLVKEVSKLNGDVSKFVPPEVQIELKKKFK